MTNELTSADIEKLMAMLDFDIQCLDTDLKAVVSDTAKSVIEAELERLDGIFNKLKALRGEKTTT